MEHVQFWIEQMVFLACVDLVKNRTRKLHGTPGWLAACEILRNYGAELSI